MGDIEYCIFEKRKYCLFVMYCIFTFCAILRSSTDFPGSGPVWLDRIDPTSLKGDEASYACITFLASVPGSLVM